MRTTKKDFFSILYNRAQFHEFRYHTVIREKQSGLCPVCVVAKALSGLHFGNEQFIQAASAIGLDENFAREVAEAADQPKKERNRPMARKLFKLVGITNIDGSR